MDELSERANAAMNDAERRLAEEIDLATAGLTPIEMALTICDALRSVYGQEWEISFDATGRFVVERRRNRKGK